MPTLKMKYLFESFVLMKDYEIIDLLDYLETIGLTPLKYGHSSHRPNQEYNSEKKSDVVSLCFKDGWTYVKGKDFILEISGNKDFAKPFLQSLEFKVTPKVNPQKLVDIGANLFIKLKACYGFAHLSNYYESGTPGRSIKDCLFGFSWLNFFGKPYIEMWQEEKILNAPAIISTKDKFVTLMLSQNPFAEVKDLIKKNEELKTYFGYRYFYNKKFETQKVSFDSIQELVEYNKLLDETADYIAPDFHKYYEFTSNNKSFFAIQKGSTKVTNVENLKENKDIIVKEI